MQVDPRLLAERGEQIDALVREIAALKAQLADHEARLAAMFHEAQLSCKVNHGTDYQVGWDDAMACIESICNSSISEEGLRRRRPTMKWTSEPPNEGADGE